MVTMLMSSMYKRPGQNKKGGGKRALTGWTYTHGCLTARGCTAPRGSLRRVSRAKIVQGASGRIVLDARFTFCIVNTLI
jgi:hypothetical protein